MAQIAVASDPVNGPLIAVLTDSGQVPVKEGSLTAKWHKVRSHAAAVAVASDATNGPLIGVLTADGEALVKEGSLTAG